MNDLTSYSTGVTAEPSPAIPPGSDVIPSDAGAATGKPIVMPGGALQPSGNEPPASAAIDAGLTDAAAVVPEVPPIGTVASHLPPDGALGVAPDVTLVITFAQPMNEPSVEAALESDSIAMSGASFNWAEESRVLRITLPEPLEEGTGEDPSALAPICYSYQITGGALDALGNPIRSSGVSFCTQRRIRRVLSPVLDRDLTGNFLSNGTYGAGGCSRAATNACVGDSRFALNAEYRGFLTFDLAVPGTASALSLAAELRLDTSVSQGNPFEDMGDLILERIRFDAIGAAAFDASVLARITSLRPVSGSNQTWTADLTADAQQAEQGRLQLRLRFENGTDSDGVSDHLLAAIQRQELLLEYVLP